MDWVETFYSKQNEWFGVYLGPVEESHHKRAWMVHEMAELKGICQVLELGGGGGQTAYAMANLGHYTTMVELLPDSVDCAQKLAETLSQDRMQVVLGDFYQVDFKEKFDCVCYFDSFGIGRDEDQRRLLKRIEHWLKPEGVAIIEVGATWYWGGEANGKSMDLGGGMRAYSFDPVESRLIDRWWLPEKPEEVYHQSLRCYTPADFKMLLEGTGLQLMDIKAGGRVDYEEMEFFESAALEEAMTYYVTLTKLDQ